MFSHFLKISKEGYEISSWQWFYTLSRSLFFDRKFLTKTRLKFIMILIRGSVNFCKFFISSLTHCHTFNWVNFSVHRENQKGGLRRSSLFVIFLLFFLFSNSWQDKDFGTGFVTGF